MPNKNISKCQKPIEIYFRDWFNEAFGYCYGTGEDYLIPLLRKFLDSCKPELSKSHSYSHEVLEQTLGKEITWLMICTLCGNDVIEYGISPRFAWLSIEGRRLKNFIGTKTDDELYELATQEENDEVENSHHCYHNYGGCNCKSNGHRRDTFCANPFWSKRVPYTLDELNN